MPFPAFFRAAAAVSGGDGTSASACSSSAPTSAAAADHQRGETGAEECDGVRGESTTGLARAAAGEVPLSGTGNLSGGHAALVAEPATEDKAVLYCQETFTNHPELQLEFGRWDWPWVVQQCISNGWGLPETNVLFMGSEGATTPAHFDEQHNFLNQVRGSKRVVLFPPDDYTRMYPFPVTHPCDRTSMVDVRRPDLARFPLFAEARGRHAVLQA